MDEMTDLPPRPDDRLTIEFAGAPRELFMSYQRLNNCVRVLGDADRLAVMMLDPDTIDTILLTMFAETPAQRLSEVQIAEDAMTAETVDEVLIWVRDHVTHFFMKRFQQLADQAKYLEPLASRLRSSAGGSTD